MIHKVPADRPIEAVIVGAGHRSLVYSMVADQQPERLKIVGVVDPDATRRKLVADRYQLTTEQCFVAIDDFIAQPKMADAVINGTMDSQHVETSIPVLKAGYDLLLEKPIGVSKEEVLQLLEVAKQHGRFVMICHVLRYAPFYVAVKEAVNSGEIGEIMNIQTVENVSYHHMAMGFVRGKWGTVEGGGSSMLMAKCCHDLDLITWMNAESTPKKVSSYGSLMHFKPEKAPEGAGTRCLVDCQIEEECAYSAKKHYIEAGLWRPYVSYNEHLGMKQTDEEVMESLKTDNPYGRCVWHSGNDVVDHQTVIVEFEDGSTASHNMNGGTAKPCRTIHIVGTKGEIVGEMEAGSFVIRKPNPLSPHQFDERKVELNVSMDMHGGGDLRLVEDFVAILRGEEPSISATTIQKSVYGHLIGFLADRSRVEGQQQVIPEI